MKRGVVAVILVASLALATVVPVASATTVIIDNNDGAGEGLNDPTVVAPVGGNAGTTLGAQRLNALQAAANIWASLVNSSQTIRIAATFDSLPCSSSSARLGQAGPHTFMRDFVGAPVASTWYPIALANSLADIDLDPGNDDIDAMFNSDFGFSCAFNGSFYLGLDANAPSGDSDLVTVALHELCHGLGFLTLVDGASGAKALGFDDTFMLNLEDHNLALLWPPMSDAQRAASATNNGDLHWVGARVVAAGGFLTAGRDPISGHVQMYAPSTLEPGSSVSHFDKALAPNEVMEPVYTGPNHDPGLAVDLLKDIGWNRCGNGVIDSGEACDDGNIADGDCCSSTCAVTNEGGSCDDANVCTDTDTCSSGVCAGSPVTDGSPCDDDNPCTSDACQSGACVGTPSPASLCKLPPSLKGQLVMKDKTPDKGDQVVWKWTKGADTSLAELGDPVNTDDYFFCVYGAGPTLLFSARMPVGGTCHGVACWKAVSTTGFQYKDKDRTPDGAEKLSLKSGTGGAAKASFKGKAELLNMPTLGAFPLPVRAQLRRSGGSTCWETVFSNPPLTNTTLQFKAKSD
jgi:cysteine-rich repeat protein